MMTASNGNAEREEIEMLLPWYVTGRLDGADRTRVEGWLQRDPGLARQLDLIREERQAASDVALATPLPDGLTVDRTMSRIVGDRSRMPASTGRSLWAQLAGILDFPTPRAVRFAAVATAIIIVAQTVAVATLVHRSPSAYETASGGSQAGAAAGTFALVKFTDAATAADISQSLGELGVTIVDGPRAGGLYLVRLSASVMLAAERDRAIGRLRDQPRIVAFATPSR